MCLSRNWCFTQQSATGEFGGFLFLKTEQTGEFEAVAVVEFMHLVFTVYAPCIY